MFKFRLAGVLTPSLRKAGPGTGELQLLYCYLQHTKLVGALGTPVLLAPLADVLLGSPVGDKDNGWLLEQWKCRNRPPWDTDRSDESGRPPSVSIGGCLSEEADGSLPAPCDLSSLPKKSDLGALGSNLLAELSALCACTPKPNAWENTQNKNFLKGQG